MTGYGKLHIGAPWAEQVRSLERLRRKQGAYKGVQDEIAPKGVAV